MLNENSLSELGISASELTARGLVKCDEATALEIAETDGIGRNHMLVPEAAVAWRRLRKAAEADSISIYIVSAYRSISRQVEIIRGKLEIGMTISDILKICAPPGYSEHHTGRAVDISTNGIKPLEIEFETTEAFSWLTKHAGEYGFSLSYPRGNAMGCGFHTGHAATRTALRSGRKMSSTAGPHRSLSASERS